MAIRSIADKPTKDIYDGIASREARRIPKALWEVARRKLDMVQAAAQLRDLASPPGNKLEKLKGNRKGMHSIRINDQWRICFRWEGKDASEVEIVDYH